MTKEQIREGSKLIAEYMGLSYIPFNDLQGLKRAGWYQKESAEPNIQETKIGAEVVRWDIKSLMYNKNGWIKNGDYYYKYVCRLVDDLRYFNSADELLKVIQKIENDFSLTEKSYSWQMGGETYYNFESFEFTIYRGGAYSEINLSLDPPMEIAESFDEKLTWTQNIFAVVVETIKYINNATKN